MDRYAAEIPFAGLVKDDRHRTRGLVLTTGKEIELKEVSEPITETPDQRSERLGLLRLLTAIQNEAHRFAQRLHKKSRLKSTIRYSLEEIPGVGPARRRALLKHFRTIKNVSEASLEELQAVAGLPETTAQAVYDHFDQER